MKDGAVDIKVLGYKGRVLASAAGWRNAALVLKQQRDKALAECAKLREEIDDRVYEEDEKYVAYSIPVKSGELVG